MPNLLQIAEDIRQALQDRPEATVAIRGAEVVVSCGSALEAIEIAEQLMEVLCPRCGRSSWRVMADADEKDAGRVQIMEIRCRRCHAVMRASEVGE